jgi:hypothetical protein
VRKLLILGFGSVLAAGASTIQFTGLPINTEFGTFNGFAFATVDGSPDQLLICDDFNHTTYVPSGPLVYDASTLAGADPLEYVRFAGEPQPVALYEQAALLLDGLQHTGNGQLLDLTADYQYALWHLFTPSVALPTATAHTLLRDTAAAVAQGDPRNLEVYSRLKIFTPEEPFATNQEFLQLLDSPPPVVKLASPSLVAPVPEPSPALLIGAGIALIAFAVGSRRMRRAQ